MDIFNNWNFCLHFQAVYFSLPQLLRYKLKDLKNFNKDYFKLYGLRVYTGRQGAGKTIGLVYDLERYRKRYPKAKIYTNFGYKYETAPLNSLNDLLDPAFKNGTDGVILQSMKFKMSLVVRIVKIFLKRFYLKLRSSVNRGFVFLQLLRFLQELQNRCVNNVL